MAMSESTFNSYLAKILSARYGEEVRGSIHDSLQGMYEIVKGNVLDVTTAKQTIDTAAAAANSAASKANTAASNADTATSKANASATKADTAAAGANSAKDAANTAASKATTEAGKATTAATQANAAKEAANTAASSANSAASAATEAAGKVDAAIAQANTAAAEANAAKTEADKAANRANDAAAIIETLDVGDINTGEIATKRYVGEQIDAIEFGGTNLIRNSRNMTGYLHDDTVELSTDAEGFTVASWAAHEPLEWKGNNLFPPIPYSVVRGKTVTLSMELRSADAEKLNADSSHGLVYTLSLCTADSVARVKYKVNYLYDTNFTTDWQKIVFTFNASDDYFTAGSGTIDGNTRFYVQVYNYSTYRFEMRKPKLEVGDKATDWSPAPEDLDAKIDAVKIGGTNLLPQRTDWWERGTIDADTGALKTATTRIRINNHEHGILLTPGAEYIVSRYDTASSNTYAMIIYFYDKDNAFLDKKVSYRAWISSFPFRFTAPENAHHCIVAISHNGGDSTAIYTDELVNDIRFKFEMGNKPTDWSPSPKDGEIGATNLLPGTKDMSGYGTTNNASVEFVRDAEGFMIAQFGAKDPIDWTGLTTRDAAEIRYSRIRNKMVTFSFEIRSDDAESILQDPESTISMIWYVKDSGDVKHRVVNLSPANYSLSNNWSKVEYTAVFSDTFWNATDKDVSLADDMTVYFRIPNRTKYTFEVRKFKLELGNKATDWSPAPNDMQPAIFDRAGNVQLSADNLQKLAAALKTYLT